MDDKNGSEIISYLDSTYSNLLSLYRKGEYHVFLEKFEHSVIKHLDNMKISVEYGEKPLRIKHERYVQLFGEIEEDKSSVYKDESSGILYVKVERVTKIIKVNNCEGNQALKKNYPESDYNLNMSKLSLNQSLDKSNNNIVERPKTSTGKRIIVPMTNAVQMIVRQANENNIQEAAVKDIAEDEKLASSYVWLEKLNEKALTSNNKSYCAVNSHLKKTKAKKNEKSSTKISKKSKNKEKRNLSGVKKRSKNVLDKMIVQNAIIASSVEPTPNEIVYKNTIHETISITQEVIDCFTNEKDKAFVYLLFIKVVADLERKCSIFTWKEIEDCVANAISELRNDSRTDDQNNIKKIDKEKEFHDFLQLFTFENGRDPLTGVPEVLTQLNDDNQSKEVLSINITKADDQNVETEEAVIQSMSSLKIKNLTQEIITCTEEDKSGNSNENEKDSSPNKDVDTATESTQPSKIDDEDTSPKKDATIDVDVATEPKQPLEIVDEDPSPNKDATMDVDTAKESTQPPQIDDDIIQMSNVNKSILSEFMKNSENTTASVNYNAFTKYWNKNQFNISDVIKDTIDGRLKEFQNNIIQVISALIPFTPPSSTNLFQTPQTTQIPTNTVSPVLPVPPITLPHYPNIQVQTEIPAQLPLNNPFQSRSSTEQPSLMIAQAPIVCSETCSMQTKAPKLKKPRKPYTRRNIPTTTVGHNFINFPPPQRTTHATIHQQFQPIESENHSNMMQRQQSSNQQLMMNQNTTNLPSALQNIPNFHVNQLINPLRAVRHNLNMNRPSNPSQIYPGLELGQCVRPQVSQQNYYPTNIQNPSNRLPSYPKMCYQPQIPNERQNMQTTHILQDILMPYSRERNAAYDVPIRRYENQHNSFETQQREQHRQN